MSEAIPTFLSNTFQIVSDPATNHIVSWNAAGNALVIHDEGLFINEILGTYFRHKNLASFIRQLNLYGFRKLSPNRLEFENADFKQNFPDGLRRIKRRSSAATAGGGNKKALKDLENQIHTLREQYHEIATRQKRILEALAPFFRGRGNMNRDSPFLLPNQQMLGNETIGNALPMATKRQRLLLADETSSLSSAAHHAHPTSGLGDYKLGSMNDLTNSSHLSDFASGYASDNPLTSALPLSSSNKLQMPSSSSVPLSTNCSTDILNSPIDTLNTPIDTFTTQGAALNSRLIPDQHSNPGSFDHNPFVLPSMDPPFNAFPRGSSSKPVTVTNFYVPPRQEASLPSIGTVDQEDWDVLNALKSQLASTPRNLDNFQFPGKFDNFRFGVSGSSSSSSPAPDFSKVSEMPPNIPDLN
jgi:hypothetical protein